MSASIPEIAVSTSCPAVARTSFTTAADVGLVVHDENASWAHELRQRRAVRPATDDIAARASSGTRGVKVVPFPSAVSTSIFPPWRVTMP